MIEAKTICLNCKHHRLIGRHNFHVWYNHVCSHPDVAREQVQDPVTGTIGYGSKNDLGRIVIVDEKHPYCRDYNQGNCPMYEAKAMHKLRNFLRFPAK